MQTRLDEPLLTQQFGARRITPLYFGQRKLFNVAYLPTLLTLPDDLLFTPMAFGWGLFGPGPGLAALDTGYQTYQIAVPTFLWGLCGGTNDNTGAGGTSQGFLVNIFHTHNGNQYQFFNRPAFNLEALGTGKRPLLFKQPHMLLPGDSLEVMVQNLGTPVAPAYTSIRVLLLAGEAQSYGKTTATQ